MENEFRKQALSHIPFDIIKSMEKETAITEADMKRLHEKVRTSGPALHNAPESITPVIPKGGTLAPEIAPSIPPITSVVPDALQKPAIMSYAIEGHVINVPVDDAGAAIQLFYTLLAFVWSKDKKVAKILKQFDFKFFDANNVQIYPAKNVKG